MRRSAVRVVVRLRPTDRFCRGISIDGTTLHLHDDRKVAEVIDNTPRDFSFAVDAIVKDASQEMVFEISTQDTVKRAVAGFNGAVLCYGQTGAGKTFTMHGGEEYRTRGIVPRALKMLFDETGILSDRVFEIGVTFVEIYNEKIRDLLHPETPDSEFTIFEDARGNVSIRGARVVQCSTEAEALSTLFAGNANRAVAAHSLNAHSSRSHVIFTINITSRSRVESESATLISKVHFIDLAGSERLSRTGTDGQLAKEANYINKSLTFLEQVVIALGSAGRSHVPFRSCRLTSLLKDSIGGNCHATLIANVWPEAEHFNETLGTLQFATRMLKVKSDVSANVVLDPATQIKQLQRQVAELSAELHMQNQLAGRSHVQYEGDITDDERFELERMVQQYVAGSLAELPLRSVREIREIMKIFKAVCQQSVVDIRPTSHLTEGKKEPPATPRAAAAQAHGVGAVDRTVSGYSAGLATASAQLKDIVHSATKSAEMRSPEAERYRQAPAQSPSKVEAPEKSSAFEEYKRGVGAPLVAAIRDQQAQCRIITEEMSQLAKDINELKVVIDGAAGQLQRRRHDRQLRGDDDVADADEMAVADRLRESKLRYRSLYDSLSQQRVERDRLMRATDVARERLVSNFDLWYRQKFSGSEPLPRSPTIPVDEQLDDAERFEAMELRRIRDDDPEAVPYYTAKKSLKLRNAHKQQQMVNRAFKH